MFILLSILLTLVAISLILVIIVQSSNGGALDGLAGNLASNVFGGQAMNDGIKKVTSILIAVFMILCIGLGVFVSKGRNTVANPSSNPLSKKAKKEAAALPTPAKATPAPVQEAPAGNK